MTPCRMHIVRALPGGLLGLTALLFAPTAHADVVAAASDGTFVLNVPAYVGQSFTTALGAPETLISFSFFSNAPPTMFSAYGTAYLMDRPFGGVPAGLDASAPGLLGCADAAGGVYNFGTDITLLPATTYYLYADAPFPADGLTGNSGYTGGQFYAATSPTGPYFTLSSANFRVTGNAVRLAPPASVAVPEPSPAPLLLLGLPIVIWLARPRPRRP